MPEYVPVEGRLRAVVPVRVKSSHAEISIQGFKLWVPCARLDKVVHRRRVILFPRGNHAQVVIAIGDSWLELGRKPLHLFRLAGRNIDLGDCATGVAVFHWRRIRQSAHSVALGMGLVPQLRGDLQFLPAFLLTAGLQEYSSKGVMSAIDLVAVAGEICRCGNCLSKSLFCLRQTARIQQQLSQANQRIGVFRIQFRRALQFPLGLLCVVALQSDVPDHVMSSRVARAHFELGFEFRHGFVKTGVAVALKIGHREKIMGDLDLGVLGDCLL